MFGIWPTCHPESGRWLKRFALVVAPPQNPVQAGNLLPSTALRRPLASAGFSLHVLHALLSTPPESWLQCRPQACPTPRRIVVRHDLASPPVASQECPKALRELSAPHASALQIQSLRLGRQSSRGRLHLHQWWSCHAWVCCSRPMFPKGANDEAVAVSPPLLKILPFVDGVGCKALGI